MIRDIVEAIVIILAMLFLTYYSYLMIAEIIKHYL